MKLAGHSRIETHLQTAGELGGHMSTETQQGDAARRFSTAIGAKP